MQIDAQPGDGYLRVIATGAFTLDGAKTAFLRVLDAVAKNGSEKVLFDGLQLTGFVKLSERFEYGKFVADAVAQFYATHPAAPVARFAYALPENILDPGRFGETVATNRGMVVKAFGQRAEALAWLEVDN
jgi:hypothetical protein